MLYLGIDQHRKQLTIGQRDERGSVMFCRQVSTQYQTTASQQPSASALHWPITQIVCKDQQK